MSHQKNMHFTREISVALNSLKAMIPNACSSSVKTRCLSTPFCSQNPASLRRAWLLNVMANWLFGEEHQSNKSMPISSRRKSFNKNPLLDGLFGTWHQTQPLTAPHSTYVPKKVFVVPSRDLRWGHPGWTPSQKHASRKARREREGRCSNSRPGNEETLEGSQGLLASNTKVMQLQLTTLSSLRYVPPNLGTISHFHAPSELSPFYGFTPFDSLSNKNNRRRCDYPKKNIV